MRQGMELIDERIKLVVNEHVAHVVLARSEKMNALDMAMIKAIDLVGERIKADKTIRAVVLSSDGEHFCAGLDKSVFTSLLEGADISLDPSKHSVIENQQKEPFKLAQRTHGVANIYQYVVWMWRELSVPVVVAIQGVTFGGGLQLALGGDCRFASPNSRFSILEMKWGLIPDMGGIQIMRNLVRDDVMRMLSYTAQEFSADKAKEWGFITDVVEDPVAHSLALAKKIAQQSPDAIRTTKKVISESYDLSAEEGLLLEAQEQDKILGNTNQVEAVMSQLQGRPAKFIDQ